MPDTDPMHLKIDVQKLKRTLSRLESLFVAKDFRAIELLTSGIRLTENEISDAFLEYPAELQRFNWTSLDVIKTRDLSPQRWPVNIRFSSTKSNFGYSRSLKLNPVPGS
jgi:hypothetical protein